MAQRTGPVGATGRPPASGAGTPARRRRRRRVRFDAPPPRARALSGWALLPLRAFLGFTFCFAGLQKLANPNFLERQQPIEHSGAADRVHPDQPAAPAPGTPPPLRRAHRHPHRAGRAGGRSGGAPRAVDPGGGRRRHAVLVAHPLPDGELPLLAVLHRRRHRLPVRLDPAPPGGLGRGAVPRRRDRREGGGGERAGTAHRRPDPLRAGAAGLWPLRGTTPAAPRGGAALRRRTAARSSPTSGAASCERGSRRGRSPDARPRRRRGGCVRGRSAAVAAGAAAGLGRAVGGRQEPGREPGRRPSRPPAPRRRRHDVTTAAAPGATTTTAVQAAGTRIGLASQVPVGGAATFTDPATGDPGLVLQLTKDQFVAYDAVCPHAGCTVGYSPGARLIVCPCHGSEFDPSTGSRGQPARAAGSHADPRGGHRRLALRRRLTRRGLPRRSQVTRASRSQRGEIADASGGSPA